jgi:hypothetical protein
MQGPPPPTPFETTLIQSYQILGGARMQSAILHQSMAACFTKCLDTEELYTLLRTNEAPIKYRLQKDLEEKKCIENCGAKWDELFRRTVTRLNQRETQNAQFKAMEAAMGGGGAPAV